MSHKQQDLSLEALLAFAAADGQILPPTTTTVAPQKKPTSAVKRVRRDRKNTKTRQDYVGKKRYLAKIKGHGFVKVDKRNDSEVLTVVDRSFSATRFSTYKEARNTAIAWGRMNDTQFLRADVDVIERKLL